MDNNWIQLKNGISIPSNSIYHGDNLDLLDLLPPGSVQAIIEDPLYGKDKYYERPVHLTGFEDRAKIQDTAVRREWYKELKSHAGISSAMNDIRENCETNTANYACYRAIRMLRAREVLSDSGFYCSFIDHTNLDVVLQISNAIFGRSNRRGIISWKRSHAGGGFNQHEPKGIGNVTDYIIIHAKSDEARVNAFGFKSEADKDKEYRKIDERGESYKLVPLNRTRGGRKTMYVVTFNGKNYRPKELGWIPTETNMYKLIEQGLVQARGDTLYRKSYRKDDKGAYIRNNWDDMIPQSKDRRYPTQKPRAVIDRIMGITTKPGDLVFDGYLGGGTTLFSAIELDRRCIACDLYKDKQKDVWHLQQAYLEESGFKIIHNGASISPPDGEYAAIINYFQLDDISGPLALKKANIPPSYETWTYPDSTDFIKDIYNNIMRDTCRLCGANIPLGSLSIDHITPVKNQGGSNHILNLQLVCQPCNSTKGRGTVNQAIEKLKSKGKMQDILRSSQSRTKDEEFRHWLKNNPVAIKSTAEDESNKIGQQDYTKRDITYSHVVRTQGQSKNTKQMTLL